MSIKVGDTVEWTSQSGGNTWMKRGVVEEVVPAFLSPNSCVPRDSDGRVSGRIMFYGYMPRPQDSYIVRVPGGKTTRAKPLYYCPPAEKLKVCDPSLALGKFRSDG